MTVRELIKELERLPDDLMDRDINFRYHDDYMGKWVTNTVDEVVIQGYDNGCIYIVNDLPAQGYPYYREAVLR